MEVNEELKKEILSLVPQQTPFRFIDEIISLNEEKITGAYRFKKDEFFYPGHFPGWPVTPGVILIETMAQIGATAFGIYLIACQKKTRPAEMGELRSLFSSVDGIEFKGIVEPGEKVIVKGKKNYFRRGVLKVEATMERESGETVCLGTLTGVVANK
ncbi:MAG TPA: beta-hydroxyacyl-ACP dehydratase [Deltaproteobacteria bacterium]|nr:beta-hydroxyacyl-ACP dehydratase [Deltaproteobacteria bacterium]